MAVVSDDFELDQHPLTAVHFGCGRNVTYRTMKAIVLERRWQETC
jgi:hypothetical protein